jgi:hypothetical protein
MLKKVIAGILYLFVPFCVAAQQPDSLSFLSDSTINDTTAIVFKDTAKIADSTPLIKAPTIIPAYTLNKILGDNINVNSKSKPLVFIQQTRNINSMDAVFYILALVVLIFALLKFLYPRYFSNLFRVFFNTSLRQGQLTDQLLQAKLPSLLFNIFFILVSGWYVYLLLFYFDKIWGNTKWQVLFSAGLGMMLTYLSKFSILKFTGWITGYKQEADTYIFIVFLINKIVAICLIPLVIIMAFSGRQLAGIAVVLSFLVIGFMLLMRFIRSYSLLQSRLKVSRFHFFIYITGIEIIPLLVIYKVALLFITKKL